MKFLVFLILRLSYIGSDLSLGLNFRYEWDIGTKMPLQACHLGWSSS